MKVWKYWKEEKKSDEKKKRNGMRWSCAAAYSRPIPAFSPNSEPIEIFKCRSFDIALMLKVNKCGNHVISVKNLHLSRLLYEGGRLGWVVVMAGKGADPWADVDFDEVQEATCLEVKPSTFTWKLSERDGCRWTTLKSFSTVSNCLTWRNKTSFWLMISGRWWGIYLQKNIIIPYSDLNFCSGQWGSGRQRRSWRCW